MRLRSSTDNADPEKPPAVLGLGGAPPFCVPEQLPLRLNGEEVLVDCVTYLVCSSVGLDVGSESIPNIAGCARHFGAVDAIREYAETIDAIARQIQDALDDFHRGNIRIRAGA